MSETKSKLKTAINIIRKLSRTTHDGQRCFCPFMNQVLVNMAYEKGKTPAHYPSCKRINAFIRQATP